MWLSWNNYLYCSHSPHQLLIWHNFIILYLMKTKICYERQKSCDEKLNYQWFRIRTATDYYLTKAQINWSKLSEDNTIRCWDTFNWNYTIKGIFQWNRGTYSWILYETFQSIIKIKTATPFHPYLGVTLEHQLRKLLMKGYSINLL